MNWFSKWLITIITAAIICAIVDSLIGKQSKSRKFIQIISGFFLLLTAVSPLIKNNIINFNYYFEDIENDAQVAVEAGQSSSANQLREIITRQIEAYIQEKATAMGADILVTVTVSTDDPPLPVAVKLEGSITPYARSKLATIIANDIGIPEDQQIWN